ncbi:MAG: hypothetical protein WCI67_05175 [Chloroflexales bacterium]
MSDSPSPDDLAMTPAGALLVNRAGRPAITITRYAGDPAARLQPILLGDEARQMILALLRAAPGVALAANAAVTCGAYALRFAPHVTAQLAGGQATLMHAIDGGVRAIAVNGQGKIVAHGTLLPLAGVSPAVAALGVWQALAVITAQHYLADIQLQLRQIAGAVAALRQWHEDRELGQIVSDHAYLERTRDLLLGGPIHEAERGAIIGQLDHIERQAGLIVAARRQSFARAAAQARALPLGSPIWWQVERSADELLQHIRSAVSDLQMLGLGLGLQAAAAQAQGMLLGRSRKGADLLCAVSVGAREASAAWRDLATTLHGRIREIDSVSDLRRVSRNLQALVSLEVDAATALIAPGLGALAAASEAAQARAMASPVGQSPPLQIIVRALPDGGIAAFQLQQPADVPPEAPAAPDLSALAAARQLQGTSGLALASWDDLRQAGERFRLRDGTSVRDFTNLAGFCHVFLIAPSGTCLFGGFVPPTHTGALRQTLAEMRAHLGA